MSHEGALEPAEVTLTAIIDPNVTSPHSRPAQSDVVVAEQPQRRNPPHPTAPV
jgi:hypothetical protein